MLGPDRNAKGNSQKWQHTMKATRADADAATTRTQIMPGVKESYGLLPFRALQDDYLPAAIRQRWEASFAASTAGEWRLKFKNFDQNEQKKYVQYILLSILSMSSYPSPFSLDYECAGQDFGCDFLRDKVASLVRYD